MKPYLISKNILRIFAYFYLMYSYSHASADSSIDCFVRICEIAKIEKNDDFPLIDVLDPRDSRGSCKNIAKFLLNTKELNETFIDAGIKSLAPLSCFTHFEELNLTDNKIVDLSPLVKMENLKSLLLAGNLWLKSVSALATLKNLRTLDLWGTNVTDLNILSEAKIPLEVLDASRTETITLNQIAVFPFLKRLVLEGRENIAVSEIAGLQRLNALNLQSSQLNRKKSSIFPPNLESLNLKFSNISNLEPLAPLVGLKTLFLTLTPAHNFMSLAKLINIEVFDAVGVNFGRRENMAFLKNWSKLQKVNFEDVQLQEIEFLENKPDLKFINFRRNNLTEIKGLDGLKNLESLFLDVNSISNLLPLVGMQHVRDLRIGFNPVSTGLCELLQDKPSRINILPRSDGSLRVYDPDMREKLDMCQ